MIKLIQIGTFYIRLDLTFLTRFNVLFGLNYCEGMYSACKDKSFTDCLTFQYAEFQLGLLFITFAFGKEYPLYEPGNQISEDI